MQKSIIVAVAWMCTLGSLNLAVSGTNDDAKADANRHKPLQRCDQLAEKAQLECLHKARERVVDARTKRQASAEKGAKPGEREPARDRKSGEAENPGPTPHPKSR